MTPLTITALWILGMAGACFILMVAVSAFERMQCNRSHHKWEVKPHYPHRQMCSRCYEHRDTPGFEDPYADVNEAIRQHMALKAITNKREIQRWNMQFSALERAHTLRQELKSMSPIRRARLENLYEYQIQAAEHQLSEFRHNQKETS